VKLEKVVVSMERDAWHAVDTEQVFESLGTSQDGLSSEEARRRLEEYGPNELREEKRVTPLELFVGQFKSILVIILILSASISAYISLRKGEPYTDTYVIMAIVIMNAILGFVQEYRAERAVEALKRMVAPHVIALRDGREESLDSRNLVPGDVVLLEAGSRVPADGRLLETANLRMDEAALTGESTPVTKLGRRGHDYGDEHRVREDRGDGPGSGGGGAPAEAEDGADGPPARHHNHHSHRLRLHRRRRRP